MNTVGRISCRILPVLLVLLLNLLSASASLHEQFHSDASHAGHQCAVTLFAHGQVDSTATEVTVALPVPIVEFLTLTSPAVFNAPVGLLPPGRAPPVAASNA